MKLSTEMAINTMMAEGKRMIPEISMEEARSSGLLLKKLINSGVNTEECFRRCMDIIPQWEERNQRWRISNK